jgi:hypothetical protein
MLKSSDEIVNTRPRKVDRIGIRSVQSILKNATQSNLSMFHNAGNEGSNTFLPRSTIKDVLECSENDNSYSLCNINPTDKYIQKELTYRRFADFFEYVMPSSLIQMTGDPLEKTKEYLDILTPPHYIRFFFSARKVILEGYTLREIATKCFIDNEFIVYPDFIGVVDVIIPNEFYDLHLLYLSSIVIDGFRGITNVIVEGNKVTTIKSSVESLVKQDYVDKSTIISNDIMQVQEYFGIEAAVQVAIDLLDSKDAEVVVNFMTRSGKFLPLSKSSISNYDKGFINDISFERPRSSINKYITQETNFSTKDKMESIKSKIWSGTIF